MNGLSELQNFDGLFLPIRFCSAISLRSDHMQDRPEIERVGQGPKECVQEEQPDGSTQGSFFPKEQKHWQP